MGRAVEARDRATVLVVEDDPDVRFGMALALRREGYVVLEAGACDEALAILRTTTPSVVVTELRLPDGSSLDLLPRLHTVDPSVPVLIVTGHGSIDAAVNAVKLGAEEFLTKPVEMSRLLALVGTAVARRALTQSTKQRRYEAPRPMRHLEEQVERLRDADCSVLILGETGTGKSFLARRIHEIGARAKGAFVDVNCAGLSREFVESELFGHERGAFTGAHAQKLGLFEAAHQGTLFLDEIGDIDAQVQPKVLKVIEEKRFRRMGDVREREVDVRLIAATHHNLLSAVAKRSFRADLYYRISTVTLRIPPLRERVADILPLARGILASRSRTPIDLAADAEDKLMMYGWPGNIRELKNVLERALLLRSGAVIHAHDLEFDGQRASVVPLFDPPSPLLASNASDATRDEIEREHIRLALAAENGRVEAAAKRLGMPRSTLYQKLKLHGIVTGRPRSTRSRS